jgi:hypothetical protein
MAFIIMLMLNMLYHAGLTIYLLAEGDVQRDSWPFLMDYKRGSVKGLIIEIMFYVFSGFLLII